MIRKSIILLTLFLSAVWLQDARGQTIPSLKNFAKAKVNQGYGTADTSIALFPGDGARLPATAPYYLVWWNASDYPDPSDDPNREIVKVTARATDTLTVVRGQQGGSAATHNTPLKTYRMALSTTAEMLWELSGRHYDVTAYGAKGDGTTDDTTAIQAAIDAAATNGGTVFIPIGTYSVSNLLISGALSFKLQGQGTYGAAIAKGTILKARAGAANVLKVLNCQKTTVEDVVLDGNAIATTTLFIDSTNAPVSTENRFKNLRLKGGTQIDLDIGSSTFQNDLMIFEDIIAESSGSVASLRITSSNAELLTFIGGAFSAIGTCPYDVLVTGSSTHAEFYNTFFNGSNNSASAYIKTSSGLRIFSGQFEGMTAIGIESAGGGSSYPILVQGCTYAVTGNTFVNHTGTQSMILIGNAISSTTAIQRNSGAGQLWDYFTDRAGVVPNYTGTGAVGIHYVEDNGTRIINDDASPGLILKRNAAIAAEYQWSIDASGNLLLALSGSGNILKFNLSNSKFDGLNFGTDIDATGGFRCTIDGWQIQGTVAASQTAVETSRYGAAIGFRSRFYTIRPGSIVGVNIKLLSAQTAGSIEVEVFKNGVATGLKATINTAVSFATATQAKDTDTFVAGDYLDLRYTTNAGWTPTANDFTGAIEIEQ